MVAVISSEFQGDKVKQGHQGPDIEYLMLWFFQMEEAKKAIEKLDVDKDGKVSYPEFILVMKYKK